MSLNWRIIVKRQLNYIKQYLFYLEFYKNFCKIVNVRKRIGERDILIYISTKNLTSNFFLNIF